MISNVFQILSWVDFSDIGINLINMSFSLAARLYGMVLDLATNTNARLFASFLEKLVNSFYVIAGIFMLFRISISVFNYILDPDKMFESKTGVGKLLINIVITVIMLIAFFPNGLVYTTLNEIEDTFLPKDSETNNTNDQGFMSRFFGQMDDMNQSSDDSSDNSNSGSDDGSDFNFHGLGAAELVFGNSAAGAFYTCTMNNEETKKKVHDAYQNSLSGYVKEASSKTKRGFIVKILNFPLIKYNPTLKSLNIVRNFANFVTSIGDDKAKLCYQFEIAPLTVSDAGVNGQDLVNKGYLDYYFFPGIIFSIALIVYMLVLGVEVIVRNLKLMLYQIIAPIPIINGIDPNDKMREKWLKGYFGAYLDLFLKVFAIQLLARLMVVIPQMSTRIEPLEVLFFLLALLVFVKMVPNIISDILGLKGIGDSFKEVTGMAKTALGVGAAAGGAVVGGAIGGAVGGMSASGPWYDRAFGALRGTVRGVGSGSKKDIFGGAKSIAATNKIVNDAKKNGLGFWDRTKASVEAATGYSEKEKMDNQIKQDVDNQKMMKEWADHKDAVETAADKFSPLTQLAALESQGKITKDQHKAARKKFIHAVENGDSKVELDLYDENGKQIGTQEYAIGEGDANKVKSALQDMKAHWDTSSSLRKEVSIQKANQEKDKLITAEVDARVNKNLSVELDKAVDEQRDIYKSNHGGSVVGFDAATVRNQIESSVEAKLRATTKNEVENDKLFMDGVDEAVKQYKDSYDAQSSVYNWDTFSETETIATNAVNTTYQEEITRITKSDEYLRATAMEEYKQKSGK